MSDYKVIKIPQAEFDKLEGMITWKASGYHCENIGSLYSVSGIAADKLLKALEHKKNIRIQFEPMAEGEFTLDMLESGKHGVELRDGTWCVSMGYVLLTEDGFIDLEYGEDMKAANSDYSNADIMKVFSMDKDLSLHSWDTSDGELIWERKEDESDSNELLIDAIDKCLDKLHKNTELFQELSQSHASDLSELNKLLGKNK